MDKKLNKYEEQFIRDGYYFLDFEDYDCLQFNFNRILNEIENGDYNSEFQYQFAKAELSDIKSYMNKLKPVA